MTTQRARMEHAMTAWHISQRHFDLLCGLREGGNLYVSATEVVDAHRLAEDGLVDLWSTEGGFLAWRITKKGMERLENIER